MTREMTREVAQTPGREMELRQKQAVGQESTRPGWTFRPDVDIVERPEEFLVTADLPGADDRHVEVRLENGLLSIDAALATQPDPAWTPLYAEYRSGGFHREFRISDAIDADEIEARMVDGVLELRLPKRSQLLPRQINVRTG